jgi:ribosomal protein S18 acetylase RimI-like enzyme
MDWRLRPALATDAEALSLLAGATLLEAFHAVIPGADLVIHAKSQSSPEHFAEWIGSPGNSVLLAEHADTAAPLGYSVVTAPKFPIETDGGDTELRRLYVLSGWHGSGIGQALMDSVIAGARARGNTRLLLGVHDDNRRARRFYERSGFHVLGRRPFEVGSTIFDDPIYGLSL